MFGAGAPRPPVRREGGTVPPHRAHGIGDRALRGPPGPRGLGTHFSSGQGNSTGEPSSARLCQGQCEPPMSVPPVPPCL
ncbi:Hypothetical predicted protein, partial [Pelobates cultripes]